MEIKTTLNIDVNILDKIINVADITGLSRTEIIIYLMKKVMQDEDFDIQCGRSVKYQKRNEANSWHIFHIKLREDDYEYLLDLRKLLKLSVSHILACAVDKYLSDIISRMKHGDNYHFKNYVILREIIGGLISWRMIWGYPHNIEAILAPG